MSGASALIRRITAVESKIRAGAAEICARTADSAARTAREIVPVETGALRGCIASNAQGLSAAATAAAPARIFDSTAVIRRISALAPLNPSALRISVPDAHASG